MIMNVCVSITCLKLFKPLSIIAVSNFRPTFVSRKVPTSPLEAKMPGVPPHPPNLPTLQHLLVLSLYPDDILS